jgi:hypothetical protein
VTQSTPPKPSTPPPTTDVDLDKLAYAVGMAETLGCTSKNSPTANARNNCHGILIKHADGSRELRYYPSRAASAAAFKRIWQKGYGDRFPTIQDARRYTGNENASTWLANVSHYYTP